MERIDARDQRMWRTWLAKHHLKETSVELLVYKKHTGKPSMSHREAMEEAICFGWIDTTLKRLDHDTFVRRFARRTDKSKWSDNTLSYAKRLLAEGRMTPEGVKRYREGKSRPTHDHGIPKNPRVPSDLKQALETKNAHKQFTAFPKSARRMFLRWLAYAKQPATRQKRIDSIVTRALTNQKQWTVS